MLRMIAKAILFVLELPFAFLLAFWPQAEPTVTAPAMPARNGFAEVKRWAAATIRRQKGQCVGPYAKWLWALDYECAVLIGRAHEAGQLEDHLTNMQQFKGLPPAFLDADGVRSWLRDKYAARRRWTVREVSQPSRATAQDPRPLRGRRAGALL